MPGYLTLYLDESGGKPWPSPWGKDTRKHYVLAGPVLNPQQDKAAHERLPRILGEFFPHESTRPSELHMGDLINARPPYDALEQELRKEMADSVWDLILSLRPTLMGTVVDMEVEKQRYGPRAILPNEYAFRSTIERFDRHLEETGNVGMVIMDTDNSTADAELRETVQEARQYGIKIGFVPWGDRRLNHILNSVGFTPSQMSPGVQLADCIAYATFSHFERGKSDRFKQIEFLWRRRGHFCEPSVIPRKP